MSVGADRKRYNAIGMIQMIREESAVRTDVEKSGDVPPTASSSAPEPPEGNDEDDVITLGYD
ncbi:hypothetical protein A8926_4915 [Saccharopolyspora spinosa]|uniref:Uncharacterized protein n=1 Tax=Saccharopolyspora spinosa TaxID=60894 RepID=A0A2N3Y278_SACSN|nr:hypothetical protein A8926_4915 [Saccharopolyspora spinosa]